VVWASPQQTGTYSQLAGRCEAQRAAMASLVQLLHDGLLAVRLALSMAGQSQSGRELASVFPGFGIGSQVAWLGWLKILKSSGKAKDRSKRPDRVGARVGPAQQSTGHSPSEIFT
jgi:hypothetical protein